MLGVVAVVGLPSARRNPTAAALVCAWLISEILYLATGNGLAVEYYTLPDIIVLSVILCKPEHCYIEYESAWHQLKCLLLERSPGDRIIICTYPLCWFLYVADLSDFNRYWGLWLLAVAQLLAAGWDAFPHPFRRHAETMNRPPDPSGPLLVVCPAGGWGA